MPAPQAQQGAAPENASTASEKSSQSQSPQQQQQQQQQQAKDSQGPAGPGASGSGADLNLPPPPLPGQRGTYTTVKRKGEAAGELRPWRQARRGGASELRAAQSCARIMSHVLHSGRQQARDARKGPPMSTWLVH